MPWDGFFALHEALGCSAASLAPVVIMLPDTELVRIMARRLTTKEAPTLHRMRGIFSSCCNTSHAVFVDSGSNEGIWSLLAAAWGCQVLAIEPQPECVFWLSAASRASGIEGILAHNALLSPTPAFAYIPVDLCHGSALFANGSMSYSVGHKPGEPGYIVLHNRTRQAKVRVASHQLDELVQAENDFVELWHVDTEGAEVKVLQSAVRLFAQQRIRRVQFEYRPDLWYRHELTLEHGLNVSRTLFKHHKCVTACNPHAVFEFTLWHVHKLLLRNPQTPARRALICQDIYCELNTLASTSPSHR